MKQIPSPQALRKTVERIFLEMANEAGVDPEKYYHPEQHLNLADSECTVRMSDVFSRIIESIQNRQRVSNSIQYRRYRSTFDALLYDLDHKKVLRFYNDAHSLYEVIRVRSQKCIPHRDFLKNELPEEPNEYWMQWCQGVLDTARFLSEYSGVDELRDEFNNMYNSNNKRHVLPELLSKNITGMGYALACDALKELGYDYAKPDEHIIDVFKPIADTNDVVKINKMVMLYAREAGLTAYKLDKMIWVICSKKKNFYLDEKQVKNRKNELLKELNLC